MLDSLRKKKKLSSEIGHPKRDLLIHGVGALFSVGSILGGLAMGIGSAATTLDDFGAITIMLLTTGTFSGISALAICSVSVWLIWWPVVFFFSWLADSNPTRELGVRALAPPTLREPPEGDWVEAAGAWFKRGWKPRLWFAFFSVLGLELAFELASKEPWLFGRSLVDLVKMGIGAAVGQLLVFAVLFVPVLYTAHWMLWSFDRLRRAIHLLREQGDDRAPSIDTLTKDRTEASGKAALAEQAPCIAPLSGTACLGFWLVGRVGDVRIDDADATEMSIGSEDYPILVRGKRFCLELKEPERRILELDAKQRQRLKKFLGARGLRMAGDIDLGETLLPTGARVTVYGAESSEMAGGSGYRDASKRTVIDDSDGLPVVICSD